MTRLRALAVAAVVLVVLAAFLGFLPPTQTSYGPPKTGGDSVWTPSPATTTEPTTETPSTPTPTTTTESQTVLNSLVDMEVGTVRNATNTTRWLNMTVPAQYVWISFHQVYENRTYAVATNCSEYGEPFVATVEDTPSWEIATNHTHNLSEWTTMRVANVDAGQVVAERTVNEVDGECSPPIPDPEDTA